MTGEGSLMPANLSRLTVKLGAGIPSAEVVAVRPNPFRGASTIQAYRNLERSRPDPAKEAMALWSR